MRKLDGEPAQLERVAAADLDRVIGGVRIGSLSASDWLITAAIGGGSSSGSSSSSAPSARHHGFVGVLGFLPSHGLGAGDDVGTPVSPTMPDHPLEQVDEAEQTDENDGGGDQGGGCGGMGGYQSY